MTEAKRPVLLEISDDRTEIYPFGDVIYARTPQERLQEEVYQSIPALSSMADATVALSHRMTSDARNALFFSSAGSDQELREVAVEVALKRVDEMATAEPDLEYLRGQKPATRHDYETAENDLWMPKPAGAAG